jgi:hypothetical protein
MELHKFLMIIAGTMVIVFILAVWFFPANDDFRIDNRFWNGISDFSAAYPIQPLDSLNSLPVSPDGATLITIPYLSYTPEELEQLYRFVDRGGRLVLADDYGHGNQVLERMGLKTRFTGQILLDPMVNYKNRQFPKIAQFHLDPLTDNITSLVFNHATSLADVKADNVLALSSAFSFLDDNGNGTHEDNEPTGPLPVISRHGLGSGQIILIADPSLFINGMEPIEDNAGFIRNIVATSPVLYIDQSHLALSELHRTRDWLKQTRGLLAAPAGTAGLVMAAVAVALRPIWFKKKETGIDTVDYLERRRQ